MRTSQLKKYLKILFTFGAKGDYNLIRNLTLRYRFYIPLYKLYELFHGSFLPLQNEIKGNIDFPHGPMGCFFSAHCVIGRGCIIMQQVTIGSNNITKSRGGGSTYHKR